MEKGGREGYEDKGLSLEPGSDRGLDAVRRDRIDLARHHDNEKNKVKSIDFVNTGRNAVSSSIDAGTKTSLKGAAWTLAGGYSVLQGDLGRLDFLPGFRYFGFKASTDWNLTATVNGPGGGQVFPRSGSISKSEDLWDGVIGLRGRLNLGSSKFYIPYYFDIGAGYSEVTWEGVVGLG